MSIHRQVAEDYTLYTDEIQTDVLVCDRVTYAPYGRNSFHIVDIFQPILTDRNTGQLLTEEHWTVYDWNVTNINGVMGVAPQITYKGIQRVFL
jgi:hypothetical protein